MKRVLLLLEDFSELAFFETLLKKVGFDCVGAQNDYSVAENLLGFSPELVILTSRGKRIQPQRVLEKISKMKTPSQVLLVKPVGSNSGPDIVNPLIRGTLDSPVNPRELVRSVGNILSLPLDQLLQKYDKLGLFEGEDPGQADKIEVKTKKDGLTVSATAGESRRNRFQEALKALPKPVEDGMKASLVDAQIKDFRSAEGDPEIEKIDAERTEFTKLLFEEGKKKKS